MVSVTATGAASSLAMGRGAIRATLGALADTTYISIVPAGTNAASTVYGSSGLSSIRSRVFTMNLDGSARTEVIASQYWAEPAAAFSPDGASLVFPLGYNDTKLYMANGSATPQRFGGAPVRSEGYPRFSRDGQWIYFNGRPGFQNCAIWRVPRNGVSAEQVSPPINDYEIDANPDPSPDGTRLVYNTNRSSLAMPVIRMLDVATRRTGQHGLARSRRRRDGRSASAPVFGRPVFARLEAVNADLSPGSIDGAILSGYNTASQDRTNTHGSEVAHSSLQGNAPPHGRLSHPQHP